MKWTQEQSNAIYKKDSNILVAAAAGSGKTAVLVERIIQKILNDGIDIDKLLVVTFTNAAASEMRERVLEAIYKKLDEDPDNTNLQRQIVLLGKSNICTIHSFCLDVIKNNFFEIDLSANFRIAAEEENKLLKQEVLEDVFDNFYEEDDEDFARLVNTYTSYRGDEPLKELVQNIYRFMQSSPFPNEWLSKKVEMFDIKDFTMDFADTEWGKIIVKNLKEELLDSINNLKVIRNKLERFIELEKYKLLVENDISGLKKLYDLLDESWDGAFKYSQETKFFNTWSSDKKIVIDYKDEAKDKRSIIKDKIMKTIKGNLIYDSKSALTDISKMYDILIVLKKVIFKFDEEFKSKKREKNIIDFNDIEHFALKILVKKDENGNIIPSDVAKKYQNKFEEIAIDEYQDSNQVQEFILNTVSHGNNIFMVGDVKQSIYKFRQACPELFLNKYEKYSIEGNEKGLKIQLFKNFRSRDTVIDFTNIVFKSIMSKQMGDIDYTKEEYLNLGASYDENYSFDKKAELDIIDLAEEKSIIAWKNDENENIDDDFSDEFEEDSDEIDEDAFDRIEKEEVEAKFVVKRINELISSKMIINDKRSGQREITYKDIVILLRSTSKLAPIYEKELIKNNIPVFSDASSEYLDTIEIQTIINLLKVIDNPVNDIALVSILRSELFGFNDNEIVEIRLCNRNLSYYDSLNDAKINIENKELKRKIFKFFNFIEKWRSQSEYMALDELIWSIYIDTGFYNYVGLMKNGSLRQANLKMLFERAKEYEKTSFKGLFNFIRFIEKLKSENTDMSAAKIISENENVVRIMSIHKSKGLEFPVVFLSSTSKRVNLQDLNSKLLLHQNIGIGPQYIDYEKRIEYSTSAKDAIKIIAKEEAISEEMRVLYVALTRAKEKLIITGISKDYFKDIEKKKEILNTYQEENEKINPILFKKYLSYLDWIELVTLSDKTSDSILDIKKYSKKDIVNEYGDISVKEKNDDDLIRKFDFEKEIDFEKFDKLFDWQYNNASLTKLPIKTTVSKIKDGSLKEDIEIDTLFEQNKKVGIENITPNFIKDDEKEAIKGSRRGTIIHNFMQRIDLKKDYDEVELEELKQELKAKKIFTEEEVKVINVKKIMPFLDSSLRNRIKNSKVVEKEKAFCMKLDAREIDEKLLGNYILVQGIIDLYAVKENGNIILVDYKTDFVLENDEISLVNKYYNQLRIYKMALEEATGKKVDEIYIYSLYLNKEISISII